MARTRRTSEKIPAKPTSLEASPQEFPVVLLLRAPEAAALCHTSARTWWAWDAAGKIPRAIRIGRSTYWRPEELKAWVAAGCPERQVWEIVRES
jgi:predicted DNA-binding transcriptional regulator AlpA